jgi:hypothetical protein
MAEIEYTNFDDKEWETAPLDRLAHMFYINLKEAFKNKTGDDESFKEAIIFPRLEYDYVNVAVIGLQTDQGRGYMIGASIDIPKRKWADEQGMEAYNLVKLIQKRIMALKREQYKK